MPVVRGVFRGVNSPGDNLSAILAGRWSIVFVQEILNTRLMKSVLRLSLPVFVCIALVAVAMNGSPSRTQRDDSKAQPLALPARADLAVSAPPGTTPLTIADITKQATTAEGHRVEQSATGARITCSMQDLAADLGVDGLVLQSVDDGEAGSTAIRTQRIGRPESMQELTAGVVRVQNGAAELIRAEVTERITTTSAGIRQDWIVADRPAGTGPFEVQIDLGNASVTNVTADQVDFTLPGGRGLAWHALAVTDATGRALPAQFIAQSGGITIRVDDAEAAYPVLIDPTFTDADWIALNGFPGAEAPVLAATMYDGGLVVGGIFTALGPLSTNFLARWNGAAWSRLGGGPSGSVYALAASGTDLYVGGDFGSVASMSNTGRFARWDGSAWHACGTGVDGTNLAVQAIAISGSDAPGRA